MKILICTVESWNSKIGANTFSELFKSYENAEIANVYIREEIPDNNVCSRYFQISESKIIKSLFKRRLKTGREVSADTELSTDEIKDVEKNKKIYNANRKKRSYLKLLARELIWYFSKWKTKELDEFIDSFKPDIVIFGMEGYIHFNRLCRYVVKKSGAKGIGYFWDDNFTYKQQNNFGYKFLRFFQRKSLKKLVKRCSAFLAITDKTKREADEFFNIDCTVLTKPCDFDENKTVSDKLHDPIRMLYTGNLYIGRMKSLIAVSDAIKEINKDEERIILDVYSSSFIEKEDKDKLCRYVNLHDAVTQDEVIKIQEDSDVLLFIESLEEKYRRKARLSFSTKITDYLKAGKCIFAIGDKGVAPMEYFSNNRLAECAYGYDDIFNNLKELLADKRSICEYAERAYSYGMRHHSRKIIDQKLSDVIQGLLKDESCTD